MRNIVSLSSTSSSSSSPCLKDVEAQRSLSSPFKSPVSASNKHLQSDMDEFVSRFERAKEIIGLEGDSFSQKAEMFYTARPEISEILDFMCNTHRSLLDRYETLSNKIQKEVPVLLREKYGLVELSSAPPSYKHKPRQVSKLSKNLNFLFEAEDSSNKNTFPCNSSVSKSNLKKENSNYKNDSEAKEIKGGKETEEVVEKDEDEMNLNKLKLYALRIENSELRNSLTQCDDSNNQNNGNVDEVNILKSVLASKNEAMEAFKEIKIQTMRELDASIENLRQENRYLKWKMKNQKK